MAHEAVSLQPGASGGRRRGKWLYQKEFMKGCYHFVLTHDRIGLRPQGPTEGMHRLRAGTRCLLVTTMLASAPLHAQQQGDAVSGHTESWTASRGAVHVVALPLQPGQFIRGAIDQGDADLTIAVRDPAGRPVAEYDERYRAVELLSCAPSLRGIYRIEVRALAVGG